MGGPVLGLLEAVGLPLDLDDLGAVAQTGDEGDDVFSEPPAPTTNRASMRGRVRDRQASGTMSPCYVHRPGISTQGRR